MTMLDRHSLKAYLKSLDKAQVVAGHHNAELEAIIEQFLQFVAAEGRDVDDWEAACLHFAPATGSGVGNETAILAGSRRIEKEFIAYFEARGRFRLDPEGRAAKHTHFDEQGAGSEEQGVVWQIAQVLADSEGQNDWEARFSVSLAESRAENRAVVKFIQVGPVGIDL